MTPLPSRPSFPRRGPRGPRAFPLLATTVALLLGGCAPETDGTGEEPAPAGDPQVLAGTFQVSLVAPVAATDGQAASAGYTTLVGKVYDGAQPSLLVWKEAAVSGACRLLTPRVPACDTPCGGSAACVEDNQCQPYPTSRAVGTIVVKGLRTAAGASEFSMTPLSNTYQPPASVSLPYPALGEGEEVRLEAAGAYYPAFALSARGISPLVLDAAPLALQRERALTLRWTPPGAGTGTSVHVKLDISHHGGTRGKIECESPDTGALELSAPLITQLLDLGAAGFPSISVTRQAMGTVTITPGRVELRVASEVVRPVEVPGITSCNEDADCPTGKHCRTDLTCG